MAARKVKGKEKDKEKVYVTLSIEKGLITLIDDNGDVAYYMQRGIEGMSWNKKAELAKKGLLDFNAAMEYKDLPKGYKLEFDDKSKGRACVSYNADREAKAV